MTEENTAIAKNKKDRNYYEDWAWRLRIGFVGGATLGIADLIARGGWEGLGAAAFATGALAYFVPQYRESLTNGYFQLKDKYEDMKTVIPYAFRLRSGLDIDDTEVERTMEIIKNNETHAPQEKISSKENEDTQLHPPSSCARVILPPIDDEADIEINDIRVNYDTSFTLDIEDNTIQSFNQLIEAGIIQKMIDEDRNKDLIDRRIIVGYKDSQLHYATMRSFYSCGIGGTSSTGKSTTVRFLLFQFNLHGFKLIMVDPHIADIEESLAAEFSKFQDIHAMPPCDENGTESRIKTVRKELKRRIREGDKHAPPILLVIDEFNGLMRRISDALKQELADLLVSIAQEGRKFGVYCWLIGQRWAEQDLGGRGSAGATIRSSLVSKIAHRFSEEDQGAKFLGSSSTKIKRENASLPRGQFQFKDADGNLCQIIVPLTLSSDGALVLSLLQRLQGNTSTTQTTNAHFDLTDDEEDLETLRTMPYREYLKTRHWQRKRKEALAYAQYRCQVCYVANTQLDVHHRTYERRGCEELSDLIVLCHYHHELYEKDRMARAIGSVENIYAPPQGDVSIVESAPIGNEISKDSGINARVSRLKSKGFNDKEIARRLQIPYDRVATIVNSQHSHSQESHTNSFFEHENDIHAGSDGEIVNDVNPLERLCNTGENDVNVPNATVNTKITESHRIAVLKAVFEMQQNGVKVTRTALRDHLGWNNRQFSEILKPICDEMNIAM